MNAIIPTRNLYSHLRRSPGPGAGWQASAARDLGYSAGYISRVQRGLVTSPAAVAALAAWKRANRVS